jgi:hypothetical protein
MPKNKILIFILLLAGLAVQAQEVLTVPAFNPAVATEYRNNPKSKLSVSSLSLPFYDDFSVLSVYPSPFRWADKFAFVNSDYAKFPPSIGVATLDALDDAGSLYPNAGPNPFNADYLTSLPIRLDSIFDPEVKAISRADSLYLSFFYQPQGRTVSPPSKDASLILEFHSPGDNDTVVSGGTTTYVPRWNEMWSTAGGVPVDSFAISGNQYFRQVMIPISDSALYYKNGFQFRFRNIAALAGNSQPDWRNNGSHWNIDVVYLATSRSLHDTTLKDVAFAEKAPSMLRNYESMPFRQYRTNFLQEMKDTLSMAIANLAGENLNVSYTYTMQKNSLAPFKEYNAGSYTLTPYLQNGYTTYPAFAKPPVVSYFPPSTDEAVAFHIVHTLTPDPNPMFRSNDSTQFDQIFSNYYAYDNGSAEAGIGINGSAGSYAVQFKLNEADTLRGIQIYFNPVVGSSNQEMINLLVWNYLYGKPGQVVKTLGGVTPVYTTELNALNTYWFDTPVVIDGASCPGLIFYIGWNQSSVNNLNVGLDRYKDSHSKRFYNVSGTWEASSLINYGSLLMRPVIGPVNPMGTGPEHQTGQFVIRPNPVSDGNISIELPEEWKKLNSSQLSLAIYSSAGSLMSQTDFVNPSDGSRLSPGLYLVVITEKSTGRKAISKLIIR